MANDKNTNDENKKKEDEMKDILNSKDEGANGKGKKNEPEKDDGEDPFNFENKNNDDDDKNKFNFKSIVLLLFLVSLILMLSNYFNKKDDPNERIISYTKFVDLINKGEIKTVSEKTPYVASFVEEQKNGKKIRISIKAKMISERLSDDAALMALIREKNIEISSVEPPSMPFWVSVFISWFPMLLLIGIWLYMLNQMNKGPGGPNQIFAIGKSKAKTGNEVVVKFADVAGVEEAKEELKEVVDFLKDRTKFINVGAKIPKGVLLLGSPGTGKTLLAKAVAGEAGVPFFSISGSEFVEMFVGVGASRVRDLFSKARKSSPCIVFIDEIDAVARQRGAGLGGGNDEREQTLNQLLVEMDGFGTDTNIIIIAATNRPDVLDQAILRPGRFDRQVVVDKPDVKGRKAILEVHSKGKPWADDVNFEVIARKTPGFVGADLANLINEAAILAVRKGKEKISMEDLEEASEKVMAGPERKSRVLSEKEKKNTAYHEVGHALIAHLVPGTDPVHKITIIPRGMALGMTMQLPTEDRVSYTKKEFYGLIKVLLGGRAAEEIIFDDVTTGASSDIQRATEITRQMITRYGMSNNIGPIRLGTDEEHPFLGRTFSRSANYSEDTAKQIDQEISNIINESYKETKKILSDNIEALHKVSEYLLEKETISGQEMEEIIKKLEENKKIG